MKAIDLCNILKRHYKKGEFECNMDSCGDSPCDLCTVEKFEKEVRAKAIKDFAEWLINSKYHGICNDGFMYGISDLHFKFNISSVKNLLSEYEKGEQNGTSH